MAFVKDKVISKLQSWKKQLLTQGGREVLIKAVATAIPIYTMECFKIPKKICEEINSAMACFWWGQEKDERKIHWVSWISMTNRKEKGGMGFRDLHLMNTALLAKQCWRILQQPDALWVRVMKGIYFPNCSVLEAKKGARASWAWASILEGRDFLKEHVIWQIMDGQKVNIWKDHWIQGCQFQIPEIELQRLPQKVAELIEPNTGEWRLDGIKEQITEVQEKAILAIPTCQEGEDRLIWQSNQDGKYSVKSGYHLIKDKEAKNQKCKPSSSRKTSDIVWRSVWQVSAPPKIRNFLWKVCGNNVAVNLNLCKKKVKVNSSCPVCGNFDETIEHALLLCEWVEPIWYGLNFSYRVDRQKITSFDEWLEGVITMSKNKEHRKQILNDIAVTCWMIWKTRCLKVFQNKQPDPVICMQRVNAMRQEINQFAEKKGENPAINKRNRRSKWDLPEAGWIKVNVDGALSCKVQGEEDFVSSVGIIVRNEEGVVLDGLGKRTRWKSSVEVEAYAVQEGVQLAKQNGYKNVIVETDSEKVINELKQREIRGDWRLLPFVRKIQKMAACFEGFHCRWIAREANKAADWIANQAKKGMLATNWVKVCPSSLVHILDKDGLPAPPE